MTDLAFWNPPTPETDQGWKSDAAIWIDPARQFGAPCFNGTRVPVATAAYWCGHEGDSVDGFMSSYNIESRRDVLVACAYWALFYKSTNRTDRRQQKAWAEWAEEAWDTMWHSDDESTAKVPDPPRSDNDWRPVKPCTTLDVSGE